MECRKSNQSVVHIAMFPWLAHGHIMPFFELSKLLASKGHKISFISTPKNLNRISNLIPQNLSHLITLISLPLPHVDGLPQGAESTSELPIHRVPFLKKAYDKLELGLTQFLRDSEANPDWIVHDFVSYWMPRVASQFDINLAYFSIFGATTIAFFGSPAEMLNNSRKTPEDFTVVPPWMDSPETATAYKLHEVISYYKCVDLDMTDSQRFAEVLQGCRFVLVRTCPEFESGSLDLLKVLYEKPVLPVGVLPRESDSDFDYEENWEGLKEWLDGKEEKSVVYVAFGTEASLSCDLMHELARGIEESGLPFVWVVNNKSLLESGFGLDISPPGFETRVSDRGLIVKGWVPQLWVLAHSSVGGLLTHSGWSSSVEALSLGRVLILLSGGTADQGLVARVLANRGVGLEITRDDKTGSFSSDLVAKSIKKVMVDQEGEPIRSKARAMSKIFGNVELQNKYFNKVSDFFVTIGSSE